MFLLYDVNIISISTQPLNRTMYLLEIFLRCIGYLNYTKQIKGRYYLPVTNVLPHMYLNLFF